MDDAERILAVSSSKLSRWTNVSAVPQYAENSDTTAESAAKWAKIYRLFNATGEGAQDEVFAAVNYYFLKNGCSPSGNYAKPIRTAGGIEVAAAEVVRITGHLEGEIRQFMRGKLEDSYLFLSNNPAIVNDEDLAAKAEGLGVARKNVWLLADWLGADCRYFSPMEATAYATLRANMIARANLRRAQQLPTQNRVIETAPETVAGRVGDPIGMSRDQPLY